MGEDEFKDFHVEMPCPICKSDKTEAIQRPLDIPNFPDHVMFNFKCLNCNFKHNDFFCLGNNEPLRHKYVAEGKDDWRTKVIRSSSATIRVPTFGASIEPGPASEGRITNIEGLILDIKQKVEFLKANNEDDNTLANANNILATIDSILAEFGRVVIIIDDPLGNSLILPEDETKLEKRPLTPEETSELKTGFFEI